ncbi:transferase [Flexivirga sp. ID2601S]|uniref:Transferase n=1 Tax=Flexivirga aerilata TaxID=1656889 RepID=A0A849AF77_9MICO|nr:methyltransferase domain-containing protein [Flexivirga aerilata]NNG38547.1 transferase [Flexivirga aerilata]
MNCRGCGSGVGRVVLDLGRQPAAGDFPGQDDPGPDARHPLAMWMCGPCGLAQLAGGGPPVEEPRGVEPRALIDQAAAAMTAVAVAGWTSPGRRALEFPSPHGGSWLAHAQALGLQLTGRGPAEVLIDSFGLMHEADQAAALAIRARLLAPGGALVLQFQTLGSIVTGGEWNALRHSHFGYYSLTTLRRLLDAAGLRVNQVWPFPLYGGTLLLVATHRREGRPVDRSVDVQLQEEADLGITDADVVGRLQSDFDRQVTALRAVLAARAEDGRRVHGYGAASRAVALLAAAGVDRRLLASVADASPAKHGRRMPGTDIPIVDPLRFTTDRPDEVFVFLAELLPEIAAEHPDLADLLVPVEDLLSHRGTQRLS